MPKSTSYSQVMCGKAEPKHEHCNFFNMTWELEGFFSEDLFRFLCLSFDWDN